MGRRATLSLSSALVLIVLALPLGAGAERGAARDVAVVKAAFSPLGKAITKHVK
jgi:hypothetical protein